MKYVGSKNKLSKDIVPIIQSYINDNTEYYIEPFVGGGNIIDKIKFSKKIGVDNHEYLIELLKYVQDLSNALPETITESEYNSVRNNKEEYPKWYVGLVGFCATFSAKWFGGYARGTKADKVTPRDIPNESIRNIEKQRHNLQGIDFICKSFNSLTNVKNSVIYCDIPYKNTLGYSGSDSFNHDEFYAWARMMKKKNNIILLSEYDAPEDFECIWSKVHSTTVSRKEGKHSKRVEKLFILK